MLDTFRRLLLCSVWFSLKIDAYYKIIQIIIEKRNRLMQRVSINRLSENSQSKCLATWLKEAYLILRDLKNKEWMCDSQLHKCFQLSFGTEIRLSVFLRRVKHYRVIIIRGELIFADFVDIGKPRMVVLNKRIKFLSICYKTRFNLPFYT